MRSTWTTASWPTRSSAASARWATARRCSGRPTARIPLRCARIAAERGIPTTALWSVDPSDWLERSSAEIARVVLREVRAGSIVDLHDCWPRRTTTDRDRTPTVEALAVVLPELAARGIRGVTVSELLAV